DPHPGTSGGRREKRRRFGPLHRAGFRMNSTTDWLANISIKWILVIAGILAVIRITLPRNRMLPRQWAASVTEFVESDLVAIVLVFLVIRPFVVQAFYIPSGSMLDTLPIN